MVATIHKPLLELTAEDLMTRDVVVLQEDIPLREAARLLMKNGIGGAPVVDDQGKCIGVLTVTDFLHLAVKRTDVTKPLAPPMPNTCQYLSFHHHGEGEELALCTLPAGVCPIQMHVRKPDGRHLIVCTQPHSVLTDWQVVDLETLPLESVRNYMTTDPVTTEPDTPIRMVARPMIDSHIHRIVVIDKEKKPIGIVSSTDVLAAVAYAEDEESA